MYSSTCFGRPHAHHQELNNCSSSLWFYRWSVVIAVLLVVVGPVGPTTTNSTHKRKPSMPPVGFEPTISEGERAQTHGWDHAVTGIGNYCSISCCYFNSNTEENHINAYKDRQSLAGEWSRTPTKKSKRIPSIFKDESTGSCICLWKLAAAVATYVSICIVYRILTSFAF
jgi:hypothetical protein